MKKRNKGFTLVEIMIVVAILGMLVAIALPSFAKSRTTSQKNTCINNLRQMDSAKEQWALETRKSYGTIIATGSSNETAISDYIKGGKPVCTANGIVTYENLGTNPTCTMNSNGHKL